MGCHFLLQATFLTQGSNLGLLNCRQILNCWATREVFMENRRVSLFMWCSAKRGWSGDPGLANQSHFFGIYRYLSLFLRNNYICMTWKDWLRPGTWDPLLQCLHLDKCSWSNKNTKKLQGMSNKCAHAVRANYGQDIKRPETQLQLLKSWEQKWGQEQKQGIPHAACTQQHLGEGTPPKPPLWPNPWTQPYIHPIYGTTLPSLLREPERETYLFSFLLATIGEVAQSCPTLCDPKDCSLPGSSVHGIFQARVLEWVAISFSKGLLK